MRDFVGGAVAAVVLLVGVVGGLAAWERWTRGVRLLNVSYDPTRELWAELNAAFARRSDERIDLRTSHGGSSSQARAVLDGLDADVVSLALWPDVDGLRQAGLVAPGWDARPAPYFSTVVFVVRKGNPLGLRDWPDLVAKDAAVVTPNPKTSGNGRASFVAAWGATLRRTGSEDAAREFVRELYRRVPVLDTGARNAALTFSQKRIGDVQLAWENEAYLQLREFPDALEVVHPSGGSLRVEPPVAVVDKVVDRKGTRAVAEAYLDFLGTPEAREILARHHYRPRGSDAAGLFDVREVVPGGWAEAQGRFFAQGGEYDRLTAGD